MELWNVQVLAKREDRILRPIDDAWHKGVAWKAEIFHAPAYDGPAEVFHAPGWGRPTCGRRCPGTQARTAPRPGPPEARTAQSPQRASSLVTVDQLRAVPAAVGLADRPSRYSASSLRPNPSGVCTNRVVPTIRALSRPLPRSAARCCPASMASAVPGGTGPRKNTAWTSLGFGSLA